MADAVFTVAATDQTAVAFNSIKSNLKQVRTAMSGLAAGLTFAGLEDLAGGSRGAAAAVAGLTSAVALLGSVAWPIALVAGLSAALFALTRDNGDADESLKKLRQSFDSLVGFKPESEVAKLSGLLTGLNAEIEKTRLELAKAQAQASVFEFGFDDDVAELTKKLAEFEAQAKAARAAITGAGPNADTTKRAKADEGYWDAVRGMVQTGQREHEQMEEARARATAQAAQQRIRAEEQHWDTVRRVLEEQAREQEKYGDQLDEWLKDNEKQFDAWAKSGKKATDQISLYADQAARNMQSAFADFLFDPFKDGLDGMLKGFIDVIRRMVAEQAAAAIFGSKDSGGMGLGDLISGLFAGGFASGGTIPSGKFGLVGEKGPEFISGPATITPTNKVGGTTYAPVYHIDARGADAGVVARIEQALEVVDARGAERLARYARYGVVEA